MRRAEWKLLPRDPRSPFLWWWRNARSFIPAIASGLLVCVSTVLQSSNLAEFLIALVMAGVFFWLAVAVFLVRKGQSNPGESAGLAPMPAPVEAFPIEFSFYSEGILTGKDHGIASFIEGWLHVEGLRTGFSLRPIDIVRASFLRTGFQRFELPHGQAVQIRPQGRRSSRETFYETSRIWHHFTVELPQGESLLPPLIVHPSAIAPFYSALALSLLGATVLVAFTAFVLRLHPSDAGCLLGPAVAAVLVAGALHRALDRLRRQRSLQRLAANEGEAALRNPYG